RGSRSSGLSWEVGGRVHSGTGIVRIRAGSAVDLVRILTIPVSTGAVGAAGAVGAVGAFAAREGDAGSHPVAARGERPRVQGAAEHRHPLAHAGQAVPLSVGARVDALAVVEHLD